MITKVCGMREPENILALAKLPIGWMGLIFYPKSPRAVDASLAEWLAGQQEALSSLKRVGVFVNAEIDQVLNAVHDYELDFVQLHGTEDSEYCALVYRLMKQTSMRKAALIKAFSVGERFDFNQTESYVPYCAFFLFDTQSSTYGGSGQQFDWGLLQAYQGPTPFFLSGGIGPEDAQAVSQFSHPQHRGIDLNSKFERAPGDKDIERLRDFMDDLKNGKG